MMLSPGVKPGVEVDLSYADFVRNYLKRGRPVLIKGALDHLPAGRWTPESLKAKYPDKLFDIDGGQIRFGDFVDAVLASTADKPAPYLRNVGIDPHFRELIPDLEPGLAYTRSNWRFVPFMPGWYFEHKATFCQFFFTGPGRGFPFMHVDYPPMDTFSALSYGRKEWLLYAPDQTPHLYPGDGGPGWPMVSRIENPFEPDLERYPDLAAASGTRIMQEAGDVIFVPCGWWHTTISRTATITVAWDHLSASCWKPFSTYKLESSSFPGKSAAHRVAVRSYLAMLALGLTVRDFVSQPFTKNRLGGRIV